MTQSRQPSDISKDINKQLQQITNQEENLTQLQVKINQLRETYMELVDEYYVAEPPFPRNRPHSDFGDDIKKIQEIIMHCIISGNDKLLEKWLLRPLRKKDFDILAISKKISDYNLAIERLINKAVSDKEKKYLSQIKEVLSNS
ncbi:MAG TPA: hypothetical protein V6D25_17185 [Leptolyngbyaceae cyanobacterium]